MILVTITTFTHQLPLVDSELSKVGDGEVDNVPSVTSKESVRVTAHGTYATQSAFTAAPVNNKESM